MAPQEAKGSKETVTFSPPIILAASSSLREIEVGGPEENFSNVACQRKIQGRVVIGAKRLTVGDKERVLSGLGIQDEGGNLLIEAFGFYGPIDVSRLLIASTILGGAILEGMSPITKEECLAAFYLAQDNRNDKIFDRLGSNIQNLSGIEDDEHPETHPLVNAALLSLGFEEFGEYVSLGSELKRIAEQRKLPTL